MKLKDKKWIRFRIFVVATFLLLGLGTLLARAYQLQILKRHQLEAIARAGYRGTVKLPPKRGTICDREGHELALSVQVSSIYAHPKRVTKKVQTAKQVALVLKEPRGQILRRLKKKRSFVWIKRRVAPERAARLRALKLDGVGVTAETRRYYPGKEIAAHLIGFAGTDNQGLEGLERKYDSYLKGPQDSLVLMRDALSRPFSISRPNHSGKGPHGLNLTIDKNIQYMAQESLKAAVKKTGARGGHCLVVDPATGEILAMAVVPEFNPNVFSSFRPDQWRNRTVTDCFEPGSTIKAFLLSACLEEGVVTPTTNFDCEKGEFKIGAHVVHDTKRHGVMNVRDIIVRSSNIGAIKIGHKLGYSKFCEYLRRFGFGSRTGIDLLGERSGFLRPPEKAGPVDQATLFFGQGMTTTSLQMAMAMSAIANGGKLMRPYVVREIIDKSGRRVRRTYPKLVRRVISESTARKAARILEGVVGEEGTGKQAAISGFRVAGKTGTAQKVDPKTRAYSEDLSVATFLGFVPMTQPKLVILVVIDEPKGVAYGGVVAGPVFREVGLWSLNYLRVNPRVHRPILARKGGTAPAVSKTAGPQSGEKMGGTRSKIGISPLRPARAVPGALSSGPPGRLSSPSAPLLPDFRGLGMRVVLKRGRSLGLKIRLEGTGLAVHQDPGPGTPLTRVSAVRVRFQPPSQGVSHRGASAPGGHKGGTSVQHRASSG